MVQTLFYKRLEIKQIFRFLLILAFILIFGLALQQVPKYLPVGEVERQMAAEGVLQNGAWQPLLRNRMGINMVLVPAGCFQMGATDEQLVEAQTSCNSYYGAFGCQQSFENEQPSHQVCISEPYWIGLTAVTNRQYAFLPLQNQESFSTKPNWPRSSVNWQQAADFCQSKGGRLPTEAEWEFAARGPDGLLYPWGNTYDIEKATLRKISPAPVAEKPAGASWVGALDMGGGIGEWVWDWYGPYTSESKEDPNGPVRGEFRLVRGGDWFAHASFFVRTTFRDPLDPDFSSSKVGFRCVTDFES